jgi:hypothetical protein
LDLSFFFFKLVEIVTVFLSGAFRVDLNLKAVEIGDRDLIVKPTVVVGNQDLILIIPPFPVNDVLVDVGPHEKVHFCLMET